MSKPKPLIDYVDSNPTPAPEEELDLDNILMLYANFCHGRGLQLSNEGAKADLRAMLEGMKS